MHRDLWVFAAVVGVAFACASIALLVGWAARPRNDADRSARTKSVIRCIEFGEHNFFTAEGADPATLEECLAVAVSPRYLYDPCCAASPVRDDILARRDGWGRPLTFERRTLSNGITEVTVISAGPNGKRDFTGKSYLDGRPKGDDLVGHFYVRPSRGAARQPGGRRRPGNADGKEPKDQ